MRLSSEASENMVDAASADGMREDDLLSSRLQSARAAQEALYSRSRGGSRLLPPPPKTLVNGYSNYFSEEEPAYYRSDLDSPRGYKTPWRGIHSPPREEFPPLPPLRTYSHPATPIVTDYGYVPAADPYPVTVPAFSSSVRRSESVPVMSSSAQFLLHTMTPVTVVTPAASPRTDVDASRAAVVSCRMLAEAGRAAAARCADEAARQAEKRVYDEMRRSQDGEASALVDRLRAENARLQEELLAERNRLSSDRADMEHYKKMSEEKDQAMSSLRYSIKQQKEEIELLKASATEKEDLETQKKELDLLKAVNEARHANEIDALQAEIRQLQSSQKRHSLQTSDAQARLSSEMQALIRERDQALSDVVILRKISEEKDQAMTSLRHSIHQQKEEIELLKRASEVQAADPRILEELDKARRDVESLRMVLVNKEREIETLREGSAIAKASLRNANNAYTYGSNRPSDTMSIGSRNSPRTSQSMAAMQMLEVDLTSDMSRAVTPVDTYNMDVRRGSAQSVPSHISADLMNSDDDDLIITTHTHRPSRLAGAGFS